ncbi:hypothetical protein SAMN05660659_05566, partial [Pseudomonas sp. LAMO17WK12:I6]
GEAVLLTRPKVQQAEADGTTLQPIKAVEALTINIDSQDLLFSDLLSVTWTGAPGTAAGGSHTTPARPISETTLTIELPVTVLAFNLGKTVTVTYTVTRNGAPRTSLPLLLNVGTLPDSSLILPVIMDADDDGEGQEFNVGNLTSNATYRMGVWPLIATGQYVWLRLKGTNADGSDYNLQIHTAPGSMVSDKWLDQGYYERSIAFAGLRNLKDGSPLTMEFKAAFGKSTDESEAVVFPVRTYTIKAIEDVRPEITRVEDSKGNEILPDGTTGDTTIKLEGKGAKGQQVKIKDGAIEIGIADIDPQNGDWELTVTDLSVGDHRFIAIALYGSEQESDPRTLTVTASTTVRFCVTTTPQSPGSFETIPNGSTLNIASFRNHYLSCEFYAVSPREHHVLIIERNNIEWFSLYSGTRLNKWYRLHKDFYPASIPPRLLEPGRYTMYIYATDSAPSNPRQELLGEQTVTFI